VGGMTPRAGTRKRQGMISDRKGLLISVIRTVVWYATEPATKIRATAKRHKNEAFTA